MEMTEDAPCWRDVADALAAGVTRLLLYGPPGTGKTFAGLATGEGEPVAERLVCTEDLTSGEVTGTWMPCGEGRWQWLDGPAIRAWRAGGGRGGRLVVDEVDRASSDALSALLAVVDSTESARWRHPESGEWFQPGPHFSVVATSNLESPGGLPASLRDRFPVALYIDRPHPLAVARLSADLRAPALAAGLAEEGRRISLRSFLAFDGLRARLGSERAAQLVFGSERALDVLDALRVASLP